MTHLQGPVPLGDKSYIERPFERRLVQELTTGRWVLLLGPRQHGKTSALVRVRSQLTDAGLRAALVDLQRAPPLQSFRDFVRWFCWLVARDSG